MNPIPLRFRPSPGRRLIARGRAAAIMALAAVLLGGCRAGVEAWGESPAAAREAATQAATSVQYRFDEPTRDPRYSHARMRIARYAMAPSKVEDDTIWTNRSGSRREVVAHGRLVDGRYTFTAQESVSMPSRVGDSRHYIALDTLPDGDRLWLTQVDQALGTGTPLAIRAVVTALLRSAERPEAQIRADYRRSTPRMTASLGRLAVLDTVRTVRLADGSTTVTLGVRLHPDRITSEFPEFAKYLRKYVSPARFRFVLRDRAVVGVHANDIWFVAEGDDDLITLRFRSQDGMLHPLDGPLRPMPDTLTIQVDASAKFGLFTVGVNDLRGRFVFVRSADEVGWDMHFNNSPKWQLPPIAGRFVRTPLDRPFRGNGVRVRLSAKRLPNGQTVMHRRAELAVHESAIMRWIGNLGFTAMDDFAGRVELEEARFFSQAMRAMRQDVGALPLASN